MTEPIPTLYHLPPSFYSQIARIVLAEKGVAWKGYLAGAGPPNFETYAPWYMRLNPGGTVPTLVHGDRTFPESLEICRYADEHFDGPQLTPSGPADREQMEDWIARLYGISIRELSYGSRQAQRFGHFANERRLANLRSRLRKNPDMSGIYEAKLRDIQGFSDHAMDSAHVESVRNRIEETLDDMDRRLQTSPFLVGDAYTLADAIWTVGVARLHMLDLDATAGRPALADWYGRMRARASFTDADIWERFRVLSLLRALATKFWLPLTGVAAGCALLGWVLLA